jgi:hypothetical protein
MINMNIETALTRYVNYAENIELIARDLILREGNFINAATTSP